MKTFTRLYYREKVRLRYDIMKYLKIQMKGEAR